MKISVPLRLRGLTAGGSRAAGGGEEDGPASGEGDKTSRSGIGDLLSSLTGREDRGCEGAAAA